MTTSLQGHLSERRSFVPFFSLVDFPLHGKHGGSVCRKKLSASALSCFHPTTALRLVLLHDLQKKTEHESEVFIRVDQQETTPFHLLDSPTLTLFSETVIAHIILPDTFYVLRHFLFFAGYPSSYIGVLLSPAHRFPSLISAFPCLLLRR